MSEKRLAFVKEGGYGMVTQGEYDQLAESISDYYEHLVKVGVEKESSLSAEKSFASVEIIGSVEEAEKKARNHEIDVLVFLTRGQVEKARKIQKACPWLRVVIYTGLIPDDEIIWVNKVWRMDTVEDILLHS